MKVTAGDLTISINLPIQFLVCKRLVATRKRHRDVGTGFQLGEVRNEGKLPGLGASIENVRLFEEIQDKSRQLEVASQHKSQFLANMSHELRTPLNAILGYSELMADGAYGEPSEKMIGVLKRLGSNGRHLLGLINDVLDLSKIEAGQLVLELADYSVQDIAQTVRSTLEPLAADKKLAFKAEVAPKLQPGRGDGRRLTQVLINLVGNAIKFTDAGDFPSRCRFASTGRWKQWQPHEQDAFWWSRTRRMIARSFATCSPAPTTQSPRLMIADER
jgi:signal transduction histidine kinase